MTLEDFNAAINSGKVIDIWRISDIMLDVRNTLDNPEDRERLDEVIRQIGIQPDGPKIILSEVAQEILDTLKEENLLCQ